MRRSAPPPSPPQELKPSVTPVGGPPGAEVTVRMAGLPPGLAWVIGFGSLGGSGYELVGSAESDAKGEVSVVLEVPGWAMPGEPHFVFVAPPDERRRMFADPFWVTGADGVLRVAGEIAIDEAGCTTLRVGQGASLALVGDAGGLAGGARVAVEGTLAGTAQCGEGAALTVRRIVAR